jgi:quercetin dioxygenase-like cupin family protein
MEASDLVVCITNAVVDYPDRMEEAGDMAWVAHPAFEGVFLKHLLRGKDSDNGLSCHLVRVDPGMALNEHIHEGQWELHEVIQGSGTCRLGNKEVLYRPGRMAIIPRGLKHSVNAGEQGLVMLAKFFPALL